jgi:hypothetical protein
MMREERFLRAVLARRISADQNADCAYGCHLIVNAECSLAVACRL